MTDYISRADAIEALCHNCAYYTDEQCKTDSGYWCESGAMIREDIPSAEAEPTVIRSRTFMPTKDFKEWAKRVREENPNVIVIPCDAEVVSADAVQGEWVDWLGNGNEWECSVCKCSVESHGSIAYKYCPMCGARMENKE